MIQIKDKSNGTHNDGNWIFLIKILKWQGKCLYHPVYGVFFFYGYLSYSEYNRLNT